MSNSAHLKAHTSQDQLRVGRKPGFSTFTFRIPFLQNFLQKISEIDSENKKRQPRLTTNKTGTSKVGAISKAQKAQSFLNMPRMYS